MPHETWKATATLQPLTKVGTKEECCEWCSAMMGREIIIIGPDGGARVVGVVTATQAEAMMEY